MHITDREKVGEKLELLPRNVGPKNDVCNEINAGRHQDCFVVRCYCVQGLRNETMVYYRSARTTPLIHILHPRRGSPSRNPAFTHMVHTLQSYCIAQVPPQHVVRFSIFYLLEYRNPPQIKRLAKQPCPSHLFTSRHLSYNITRLLDCSLLHCPHFRDTVAFRRHLLTPLRDVPTRGGGNLQPNLDIYNTWNRWHTLNVCDRIHQHRRNLVRWNYCNDNHRIWSV